MSALRHKCKANLPAEDMPPTIMRLGYPTNTRARSAIGGDALALGSAGRRVSSAFENDFSSGCAPTGLRD